MKNWTKNTVGSNRADPAEILIRIKKLERMDNGNIYTDKLDF